MNKRIIAAMLALLTLLLSGCQLAQPQAGGETQADRLVGVFVTLEYLDLMDWEAFVQENAGALVSGGTADTEKYAGRLYAQLVEESFTDSMGETHTSHRYQFSGVEGYLMASFEIHVPGEDIQSYVRSESSEGLCDVITRHNSTGDGQSLVMEATLYAPESYGYIEIYPNPVYQTADGQVYLTSGQGLASTTGYGGSMNSRLSESVAYTQDGQAQVFTSELTVNLEVVKLPEKVVILHMDSSHRALFREEYHPSGLPGEITPAQGAAYLLVEEHRAGEVHRFLTQPGDDPITILRQTENGLAIKHYTQVAWAE